MKISWGHGVVIALACFIIFILSMIFLFPNGQKNSEMITDNYYEEELKYQDVIDAKNRADQLAEKSDVEFGKEGIKIIFPENYDNHNTKFDFYLYRTDDQNLDVKKEFTLNADHTFLIPAKILSKGNYILKVKWITNKTQYQRDYDIQWK